ncbi:hypothetical protein B0H13DRAFT_1447082, partial [Mycena leptocephala]
VKKGYVLDPIFSKVLESPTAYPQFQPEDGLLYDRNVAGDSCLCVPRLARLNGKRALTEIVLDDAHSTIGHLGDQRSAAYVRRWYWW